MFAIREDRDHCLQEDFMKVRSSSSNQSPRRLNFILNLSLLSYSGSSKDGRRQKTRDEKYVFF